jgi:hypothetical protein
LPKTELAFTPRGLSAWAGDTGPGGSRGSSRPGPADAFGWRPAV